MSTPHPSEPSTPHAEPLASTRPLRWVVLLTYSAVVCALHFGGLAYELYTSFWWWDLLTHSLSGAGVAAWLWLCRPVSFGSRQLVVVPLVVLAIGAGFEVYEYLFKTFYVEWTLHYYVVDTVVDLALDALGAAVFVHAATHWPSDGWSLTEMSADSS